ncbi:ABC transporter ATP-binding protein [Martelella alba]|uniref:Nickel import system ATP-binding protein NikD n=1 Tax=Martelella alba TaxID=2590451 RepID=A0A506UJ45_9HYPH|nr:ABC transporter ATP-binding protein [Martelella alba]TPW33283.1 ABC transporter ATP-binding protein [Martelella alba]
MNAQSSILSIRHLTTRFPVGGAMVEAVDNVNLDVREGEILGLVGESGSGKSVTLRSMVRLLREPATIEGQVIWQGRDLMTMSQRDLRRVRGGEISMIFQEPMTALNPILPIRVQIEENLAAHTDMTAKQRYARALELLDIVGIPAAKNRLEEFPHQFSGGMRQRAMIAIALAASPKLLLADEPTTALDVTIQDQILKLILDLRDSFSMSVVLVTHDLGVVASTCDRVAVMYAGRIVESADVASIFSEPHHAYTYGLIGSVPRSGQERKPLLSIEGTPPSLADMPAGCAFNPRCSFATERCRKERPLLVESDGAHMAACFHQDRVIAEKEALQ